MATKPKNESELTAEKRRLVIERLEQITRNGGGVLTPDAVVEDTKNDPKSPLREYFTWDVRAAARERWVDQARTLIARVHYVVTTEYKTLTVPVYVRDPAAQRGQQGYRPTADVREDPDAARNVMVDELRRLRGLLERCRALAVVLNEEGAVDELVEQVSALARRVTTRGGDARPSVQ
jgi:hypothetical protein